MKLVEKNIAFIYTGALNSVACCIEQMKKIKNLKNSIYPIMSFNVYQNLSIEIKEKIENIAQNKIIHNIKRLDSIDIVIVEPCTGNTLSKIANNIVDTPAVYFASKAMVAEKPLIIGISSFSGINSSLEYIGKLIKMKHVYFIPFRQTNPIIRPNYLMCDPNLTIRTAKLALEGIQLQPILL